MKHFFTIILLMTASYSASAQDCVVEQESLKGIYKGDCVKGKADGKGIATGTDQYEGDFKKGMPEGMGTYTWKNKDQYTGSFKKGMKDGKGQMHYDEPRAGVTAEQTGYWKKDKFIGEYEKPFEVKSTTTKVSRINCRLSDAKGKNLSFNVSKLGEGLVAVGDIVVITGRYYNRNTQNMTNLSVTRLTDVTFPFRAIFNFTNGENAEIIFYQAGDYDIEVQLM
ncbi:MAG: hypothetical protein ABIO05_05425 [Ferruginibacter sp.]